MLVNYGISKPFIFGYLLTNQLAKCLHWLTCLQTTWEGFVNYLQTTCEALASGLQVKKTLRKWFASGSQVVHKPFASGL